MVFAIALIEYPIPHMSQARVCATELQVLVELRASGGQLARTAMTPTLLMAGCMVFAIRHRRRAAAWQALEAEVDESEVGVGTVRLAVLTTIVWLVTVGTPAGALLLRMHDWTSWTSVIGQFSEEWGTSLAVSMGAGILSVLLSMAVVWFPAGSGRSPRVWAWLPVVVAALVPPTILGLGFIAIFNRSAIVQGLYVQTAWVWMLALTARYGLIAMLIAWVTVGRRGIVLAEQARVDGAWPAAIVTSVLIPTWWPAMLAGGLIVGMLSLFEVAVTQMVAPVAYRSISLTLLNLMHYGRDDIVIAGSLLSMIAGCVIAQVVARLCTRVAQ